MRIEIVPQWLHDLLSGECSAEIDEKPYVRHKGKSLLRDLCNYTVIDIETTGLDPQWDSIIELAALRVRNGAVTDTYQQLVRPADEISSFITDLTGITNEMLSDAPEINEVLDDYLEFIGNDVLVGHNVSFDINFIYDQCELNDRPKFQNDYIDTMRLSRRLFPDEKHHRLKDLVARFGIGSNVAHRALQDAADTQACYGRLISDARACGIDVQAFEIKKHKPGVKAADIIACNTDIDPTTAIYGKCFVFTGTLSKMNRKDAMQIVVNMGGICGDNVTKKTDFLVLGNNDYCTTIKDGKSNKQKKAEQLRLSGQDIEILSENTFYSMIQDDLD